MHLMGKWPFTLKWWGYKRPWERRWRITKRSTEFQGFGCRETKNKPLLYLPYGLRGALCLFFCSYVGYHVCYTNTLALPYRSLLIFTPIEKCPSRHIQHIKPKITGKVFLCGGDSPLTASTSCSWIMDNFSWPVENAEREGYNNGFEFRIWTL